MAFTTQEQLKALLQMQDIGEQEDEQAKMQAYAEGLRGPSTGQGARNRMDWASQAARGIQGIASGYGALQAKKQGAAASAERRKMLQMLSGTQDSAAPADYTTMPGSNPLL